MFTTEEYFWAWALYLLGAGLFLFGWWFLTGKIKWREPRYLLRLILSVLLLTPWYTDDTATYISPAWVISAIEGAFEGPEAFWRAGYPLLMVLTVSLIISSVLYLGLWFYTRRRAAA